MAAAHRNLVHSVFICAGNWVINGWSYGHHCACILKTVNNKSCRTNVNSMFVTRLACRWRRTCSELENGTIEIFQIHIFIDKTGSCVGCYSSMGRIEYSILGIADQWTLLIYHYLGMNEKSRRVIYSKITLIMSKEICMVQNVRYFWVLNYVHNINSDDKNIFFLSIVVQ